MYIFPDMIDLGINTAWSSSLHRDVAIIACIGNPQVNTMDKLSYNIQIINNISSADIPLVTIEELLHLGCDI